MDRTTFQTYVWKDITNQFKIYVQKVRFILKIEHSIQTAFSK